jgi:hypothetical protein
MPQSITVPYEQVLLVVGAYGLLWLALIVFIGFVFFRLGRIEQQFEVVEETLSRRMRDVVDNAPHDFTDQEIDLIDAVIAEEKAKDGE